MTNDTITNVHDINELRVYISMFSEAGNQLLKHYFQFLKDPLYLSIHQEKVLNDLTFFEFEIEFFEDKLEENKMRIIRK